MLLEVDVVMSNGTMFVGIFSSGWLLRGGLCGVVAVDPWGDNIALGIKLVPAAEVFVGNDGVDVAVGVPAGFGVADLAGVGVLSVRSRR